MYELTYIVNPNLSVTDLTALNEKVKSFIAEKKGQIKNEIVSSKKQLSYNIKKQGFAYYVTLEFIFEPGKIKELIRQIKSKKNIIRHLMITRPPERMKAPKKVAQVKKPKIAAKPLAAGILTQPITPTKEKIKLEDLDKKLEEILEE